MATQKKEEKQVNEPIQPIEVVAIKSPIIPMGARQKSVPGKVELVELDDSGQEVGASFFISEQQYKKTFANNPKFKLKKNIKQ